MVVLTGDGASHKPSKPLTHTSSPFKSITMDTPGLKGKSSLAEKSAVQLKLVPLVVKRNNNNNNNTSDKTPLTNGSQIHKDEGSDNNNSAIRSTDSVQEVPKNTREVVPANEVVSVNAVAPPKRRKGRPPKSSVTLKASVKAQNASHSSKPARQSRVLLDNVIPFITCNLCRGYLIDATTIVECLHTCKLDGCLFGSHKIKNSFTFVSLSTVCHSCIMIHLRQKQYCPCCELMINKSKPNIK